MKNLKVTIVTTAISLLSTISFGQNKDSVYVINEVDEMSGKNYIYSSREFICSNSEGNIGFKIDAHINSKDSTFSMITATMVGIGACNENDEIILLFANGEKITRTSWKGFNCEGTAYFYMYPEDLEILRTQTLSKIRMTNGRTYDSYTGDVKQKDKRYFIQLFYALDNKLFTNKK